MLTTSSLAFSCSILSPLLLSLVLSYFLRQFSFRSHVACSHIFIDPYKPRNHTWEITHSICFFGDWLNSLNIFSCICFPENDTNSFFMAEKSHCARASHFLYLVFCRCTFGGFHNWANMIGAEINFNMQTFMQLWSPSVKYQGCNFTVQAYSCWKTSFWNISGFAHKSMVVCMGGICAHMCVLFLQVAS